MTTTTRPYPRPARFMTAHIIDTLPAWHEDPLRVLLFRVQRMRICDAIEHNGWRITKSFTSSEGVLWRAYKDDAGVRVCKSAQQAVDVVTGTENGQQETHNQDNEG